MPMVPRRLPTQKSAETTQLYHSCCGKKAGDCPGCPEPCTLVKKAQLQLPVFSPNQIQDLRGGAGTSISDAEALRQARNDFWAKHIYRKPEPPTRYDQIKRTPQPKPDFRLNVETPSGRRVSVNVEELARNLGVHPTEDLSGKVPISEELRQRIRKAVQSYITIKDTVDTNFIPYVN